MEVHRAKFAVRMNVGMRRLNNLVCSFAEFGLPSNETGAFTSPYSFGGGICVTGVVTTQVSAAANLGAWGEIVREELQGRKL